MSSPSYTKYSQFGLLALVLTGSSMFAQTNITIGASTLQPSVKRMGMNLGQMLPYGSQQIYKNLFSANPGFNNTQYQSVLYCGPGTSSSACVTRSNIYYQTGFWPTDGSVSIRVMTGAAAGCTTTLGSWSGATFGLSTPCNISDTDYIAIKKIIGPGAAGFNPTYGWNAGGSGSPAYAISADAPPAANGTTYTQSLQITTPTSADTASLSETVDNEYLPWIGSNQSFVNLSGTYTISYWAKAVSGASPQVTVSVQRGGTTYAYVTDNLTSSWANYTHTFTASETGPQTSALNLSFQTSGVQSILLAKVSVGEPNTTSNPTAFRNAVVSALQSLKPGVLRMSDQEGFTNTLNNMLVDQWARMPVNFSTGPVNGLPGYYNTISYSIPEFLQLCQTVGADAWISIPISLTSAEASELIDYLSGPASTPGGAIRVAQGFSTPWTSVLSKIHLELGNEEWNGTFEGGSMEYNGAYGPYAQAMFGVMKANPNYNSSVMSLAIGGQFVNSYAIQGLQNTINNNDEFGIAPYTSNDLTDSSSIANIWQPGLSEPQVFWQTGTASGSTMVCAEYTFGSLCPSYGYFDAGSGSQAVYGGGMYLDALAVAHSSHSVPLAIYEENNSPRQGTFTQAQLNAYASAWGAGLMQASQLLTNLQNGVPTQIVFQLGQYFTTPTPDPTSSGATYLDLWGSVVDMGGATNLRRPQFLAEQLINSGIANGASMLTTTQTGTPTFSVGNPAAYPAAGSTVNTVATASVNTIQSFAFNNGSGGYSLVLLNLDVDSVNGSHSVTFSGSNAPSGNVNVTRLSSTNLGDNNESALVITPVSSTLVNPSGMTLAPYSMYLLTWGTSQTTAANIAVSSGSGQTVPPNTVFTNPLVALVKDAGGNPVANASVTFTSPTSGASATFAGGGTTVTVQTNSSGLATSPTLTSNANTGAYSVTASVPGATSTATFTLTNAIVVNSPGTISVVSGSGQSATINTAFGAPLVVIVKDSGGNPVSATVTFSAPTSGASGSFNGSATATTQTNSSGIATSPTFTANGSAGSYLVSASATGTSSPADFTLTNAAPTPASIAATSGSGQSAAVNTTFTAPLAVIVKDSGGNPVANATVTFSAPASGSSGTFSASRTTTAQTNNSGVATAPAFTANGIAGSYSVSATVAGVSSSATFSLTNIAGSPASITATSGGGQSTTVITGFTLPLTVTVKDAAGNPVANAAVTFSAPTSGASATFTSGGTSITAQTNSSGVASSSSLNANGTAGSYIVTATVSGASSAATFSLTNTAAAPASITASSGAGQSAQVRTAFTNPLVVTLKDTTGNPISNFTVTFTAPAANASGTFTGGSTIVSAQTNAAGVATSPAFTANATAGSYSVIASANGLTTSFALTNTAAAPGSITVNSGNGQSATINTFFSAPFVVTVKDSSGNPLPSVSVTFTAPSSGASGAFNAALSATVQTNSSGVATSPAFIANATAGNYSVTATVNGVSTPAIFSLTNFAGPAATVTLTSGSNQSTPVSTAFANPLVAMVKDSSGNPVTGTTVTFTAPGSGPTGTFAGASTVFATQTNSAGLASTPTFTANGAAGSYSVVASVAGINSSAVFALTNTAGSATTISLTSGTPQSTQVNTSFSSPLVVTVKDSSGNLVANAVVTFTAPSSGASATFSSTTVQSNSSGVAASPIPVANSTAGSYSVVATLSGASSSASFALTNTAGGPSVITVTSGSGQSTTVNTSFAAPLVATVKDSSGNPVPNTSVLFAAPSSGASATFSGTTVQTNSSGVATSPTPVANGTSGTYSVSATATSVSTNFTLTNNAGSPASVSGNSGNGQTAIVGATFATPLSVTVKDSSGNPVPNVTVNFSAPTSGATASFAGSGNSVSVQTNSAGTATSPALIANTTAGAYTISTSVPNVSNPFTFSLTNAAGTASTIAATSGGGQAASVTTVFSAPLAVTVKDEHGNPVSNIYVIFTAPVSGASATFTSGSTASVQTNSSGLATSPALTANSSAGNYSITASVAGVSASATFALTNNAGAPGSITSTSGSGQSAQVKTSFSTPLVATVKDASTNPVANVTVTFSLPASGASASFTGGATTATAQTNSFGIATSPSISANGTAGSYTATASVPGVSAQAAFALTNTAGAPGSITATSGSVQTTAVSTAFANALVATVKDSSGNPVSGVTVTFTAPATGASANFSGSPTVSVQTNLSGVATSPTPTANATAGSYSVTAAAAGAVTPAAFTLTNTAGTASTLTVAAGNNQSTPIRNVFSTPFSVTVKDTSGNPISGVSVTFSAPTSGASGTFAGGANTATVQSSTSGVATAPAFSANITSGSYSVIATVPGTSASATFALTNIPALTVSISALANGTAGLAYSATLTVQNGTAPYLWSITAGALPQGLTLNSQNGTITGMPTATGTFPFTVSVTDASGQTATQPLSLFINPPLTNPVTPTFTISGLPSSTAPGQPISAGTVQLSQASSAAFNGTLTLSLAPNSSITGLPAGYLGDAALVDASGKNPVTTESLLIPASTTSVTLPYLDPGTVAGNVTMTLSVGGEIVASSTTTVQPAVPTITATPTFTNMTSTGFDIEVIAISTTRDLTTATFTFTPAAGAQITGTTTFSVPVSSVLSSWFATQSGLGYGGSFSLTVPFTISGSINAIQSVTVTLTNSVGTSAVSAPGIP